MSTHVAQSISVVIPVYKSGAWLADLAREIAAVLSGLQRDWELILVDDCSPDASWAVIQELSRSLPQLGALQLMHNEGQARATLCGLAHARGAIVLTMDDDFQHPPDQIPLLLAALDQHPEADAVLGYFPDKQHATYRNWGSRLIQRLNARAFRMPPGIRSSGFRALRRPLVDALVAQRTMNPVMPVLLFGATQRVLNVPVAHAPRRAAASNYTLRKQLRLALDNICTATVWPLRLVTVMGLASCGLALLLAAVYFVRFLLLTAVVPGWTTVVLLLTFFSGLILLALGIIGEYMARILREVRPRPGYLVRAQVGRCAAAGDAA